jgi:protease-4
VRRLAAVALVLVSSAGCLRPLQTIDRLRFDGPLLIETPPDSNAHPVVAMPVENGAAAPKTPHVAVVDVDGLLLNTNLAGPYSSGDNPVDLFREKLDSAAADPCGVALVVRINSPGGSVTATDVMWRELRCFREKTGRPVVACLLDLGCGGAYYLATAADVIVAHPTTVAGGIGVVLNLYQLQDAMGLISIVDQSIRAGANTDLGGAARTLKPEARALLQATADEFYERFRAVVLDRRPQAAASAATALDGRVFSGQRALQFGLVDRVGYLADALDAARELSGRPEAKAVLLHRSGDVARTPFSTTPNVPLQGSLFPASLPGLERSKLPTFLYLWQPDPTLERLGGK